jgi:hypothetical protein
MKGLFSSKCSGQYREERLYNELSGSITRTPLISKLATGYDPESVRPAPILTTWLPMNHIKVILPPPDLIRNKIEKVYSLEYINVPKVFFKPHTA